MARHLGCDDRRVGADISVVRRDEETPVDEPVITLDAAVAESCDNDCWQYQAANRSARLGFGDWRERAALPARKQRRRTLLRQIDGVLCLDVLIFRHGSSSQMPND